MNFLKQGIGLCLALLLLLVPTATFAEAPSSTVDKKEETVGRVTIESKEYPFHHYMVEAKVGDGLKDTGDIALHAINSGIWGFNKTIASFTLYSVDQLMSFDLISLITSEAGVMSERIYDVMSGTFLSLFIIFVGGTAAWRYFVNQQVGHAIKAILGALVIMAFTFWFYSNATGNIKWLNDRGAELEGIASSVNVLVSSDKFDSNAAYNSKEGMAVLENQLFNLMVKRPYLLLNYGSTKEVEVVSEDPNRVDKLLAIKPYSIEGREEREKIVSAEVSELDNKQMTPEFSGERFGYLIMTIISTIALSIPILLLAVFKFLLQVWFLALVIFSGIPLVLSLIPSYSESALNHGKKLVGVLLMKAGLVLLIAVITGLVTLIYESVKVTNGVEGYMFVVFVICITMWGLFTYRSEIFEVASAGMVQGQQTVERVTTNSLDKMGDAGEKGFKGAKRMVGKAYNNHQNKKHQEGAIRKVSTNGSLTNGQRSEHRKAVGENTSQKQGSGSNQKKIPNGQGVKNGTVAMATGAEGSRSALRNTRKAIVKLEDYKSGKSEGDQKNSHASRHSNRSEARNPGSNKPSESRKKEEGKLSTQRTTGMIQQQPSPHRKSPGRMEGHNEVAASREPEKHITQWEAQQQINKRNANPSKDKGKKSERRKVKAKVSKQRK
ncbi:MAG: CD3337/EF1877 family mobilome membrane protein [Bacillota bacterium]